jgi:hypothetical protein
MELPPGDQIAVADRFGRLVLHSDDAIDDG